MTFGYSNQTGKFGLSATPNEDTCTSIDIDDMDCLPGEVAIQVDEDGCTCKPADHTSITAYAGGFNFQINGTQAKDAGIQINHCTAELTENGMAIPHGILLGPRSHPKRLCFQEWGLFRRSQCCTQFFFQNTFNILKPPAPIPADCSDEGENLDDTYARICSNPIECADEPACDDGERHVLVWEDDTYTCQCAPSFINNSCNCGEEINTVTGAYAHIVPKKLTGF